MNGPKREPVTEITNKGLDKDFKLVKTLFSGNETEDNWTERVNSLTWVEEMLNADNISNFKETIAEKINENIAGIMQSILSMRSTLVLLGFSLISTVSATIGGLLACSTVEIILNNLIDRSSKVPSWFPKLNETTIKFLSHTNFYPSIFDLLKKKTIEGNSKQLELCCIAIKIILLTHGTKEYLQIAIEGNPTVSSALEFVLEKGLEKGNPGTKAVSKEIYSIYNKNWRDKAELLRKKLSPEIPKWLLNTSTSEKSTTKQTTFGVSKKIAPSPKQRVSYNAMENNNS
ncbi:clasp N terminal-domain-containing protein [Pilaira anomala]|nr:clasp N terminal-domain-containing protein [Pilaira anomala]